MPTKKRKKAIGMYRPGQVRGKYTGAMLREIRATGQERECARRLRQREALEAKRALRG